MLQRFLITKIYNAFTFCRKYCLQVGPVKAVSTLSCLSLFWRNLSGASAFFCGLAMTQAAQARVPGAKGGGVVRIVIYLYIITVII